MAEVLDTPADWLRWVRLHYPSKIYKRLFTDLGTMKGRIEQVAKAENAAKKQYELMQSLDTAIFNGLKADKGTIKQVFQQAQSKLAFGTLVVRRSSKGKQARASGET